MQIHQACLGRANHSFVFLEDLIRRPDQEWARLCQFLGLRPDIRLEDACSQTIADLEHEPWKRDAVSGLPQPMENKTDELFTAKFKLWLDDHLESYDSLRAKCLLSRDSAGRISHRRDSGKRTASISRAGMSR